jgi:Mg2+ and Co2+ transporter CorA
VLTVPMLIASIFGMNTWLPFANAETWGPMGFIMILGIAFLLMILTVIFFARRRFF